MVRLRPRGRALAPRARDGLARVLERATFEVLPLRTVGEQLPAIPRGQEVSITASPAKGLEATVDLAVELERRGFLAVPHLSARMVRDRAHLRQIIARMADGGIERAFVVGGDAREPGEYKDALSLLRALADAGARLSSIGIAGYPDGHPFIPDDRLLASLRAKAALASYVTTQLCFDPRLIEAWVRTRRAEGFLLPVVLGVPGVTQPHRLLSISARIGVRDASRFLLRNVGLATRLVRSGGFYRPDALLTGLAPLIGDPAARIRGVHLYTFNQVATTAVWREATLARLHGATPRSSPGEWDDWRSAGPDAGWLTPTDR